MKFKLIPHKYVLVLAREFLLDSWAGLHVLEFRQEFEGTLGRIQLLLKGGVDKVSCVDFNDVDLLLEGLESGLPLGEVLGVEHIVVEGLKFAYLVLYTVSDGVDRVRGTGNSLEVIAENGEELLEHDTGSVEVGEDEEHVLGAYEDVFDIREVPASDGDLGLNIHLCLVELVLPLFEDSDTLLDDRNRLVRRLLEDDLQLNMAADLGTDLVGDCFQDMLEFGVGLVDVARNSPNELETVQKTREGLLDGLEVAAGNVFELALERGKEFDKVLSFGVVFGKLLVDVVEGLDAEVVDGVFLSQNLNSN